MPETIFSKIIAGDIPCHRVYEDEHVLAFLDIGPLSLGHTLLIPKQCVQHVHELDEAHASALGRILPRLCRGVLEATGATAYNVLVNSGAEAGQEVPHVHIHIIPRSDGGGLQKTWTPGKLSDEDAARLKSAIAAGLA